MRQRVRMALTLVGAVLALAIFVVAFQFIQSARVATSESTQASEGVKLTVTSASIPGDRKPVVSFKVTDSKGSPLRLSDLDGNPSFTIAVLQQESGTGRTYWENPITSVVRGANFTLNGKTTTPVLESVTRPGADSGGVFTDKGGGTYQYAFRNALPQTVSNASTIRIGGQSTRSSRAFVSNSTLDFVPNGGVATSRQVVTTEACNGCHDPLAFHGGTRREVGLCVTCHTSQTIDPETGDTVDFKVMVHKIHRGVNLPSVKAGNPYYIVGNSQNVYDFSGVRLPQDTRNCTTCHTGPQGDVWKTQPSAEACGSCHEKLNFKTGANHGGGAQPNTACKTCHPADGAEFDLSVSGSHTIQEKSKQNRGVNFEIKSFTNTKPGQSPTVVFNIKDNAGQPIKPLEMSSLSLVLAGPTTEYTSYALESATGATATADGNYSYTFQAKIPAEVKGTYAVGINGFINNGKLKKWNGKTVISSEGYPEVRDVGFGKVAYGAVTDAQPLPRKQVVDNNKCNACHQTLGLHGGSRQNTEFCILCHNPNTNDASKRATAGGSLPPVSVNFGPMIHKIHTGEEQNDKLVIYGGPTNNIRGIDLSEARYPGDRQNCEKCHVAGSQLLSYARPGMLPTVVKVGDKVFNSTPPTTALCTGCHDSGPAKTHAAAQSVNSGESCVVCHSETREFAVSTAHAR